MRPTQYNSIDPTRFPYENRVYFSACQAFAKGYYSKSDGLEQGGILTMIDTCPTIVNSEHLGHGLHVDKVPETGSTSVLDCSRVRHFDFGRNWRRKIVPLLDDSDVSKMLTLGLKLCDKDFDEGDPPWLCGRGQWNGQRVREGCLSWYQPWGRCHNIAPFSWALGKKLYPEQKWGFITGTVHTVVIGCYDDWRQPERVMDILFYKKMTAQESLTFAMDHVGKFYGSLARYLATFFVDPEDAYEMFRRDFHFE